ncbi:hypothetical protein GCM10009672_24400 [Nesterenkonia lutea]
MHPGKPLDSGDILGKTMHAGLDPHPREQHGRGEIQQRGGIQARGCIAATAGVQPQDVSQPWKGLAPDTLPGPAPTVPAGAAASCAAGATRKKQDCREREQQRADHDRQQLLVRHLDSPSG